MSCTPSVAQHVYENTNADGWVIRDEMQEPPRQRSYFENEPCLVAIALAAHVLQRGAQAFIILVTQCNKAERVRAGAHLRGKKFHQPAHRTGKRVYLGFSNGGAADTTGKLRQAAGKRNLLQHRGNLMAAEVEANGFVVGDSYSRRPRLGLRFHLGKVWHE